MRDPSRRLLIAGGLIGVGLVAFLDGLLFHQVLGWHHMFTSAPDAGLRENLRLNEMADGLFHLAAWLFLAVGVWLLWRARHAGADPWFSRRLLGAVLLGAGLFEIVEGLVNHQLLGIHHVHPTGALPWDLAYLAFGAILALAGGWLLRSGTAATRGAPRVRPGWRSG